MNLEPTVKLPYAADHPHPIEKWPLRKAFTGYVPDEVLWRQKEQFSDGVGYSWIDGVKAHAEREITDNMLRGRDPAVRRRVLTIELVFFLVLFAFTAPAVLRG